MGKRLAGNSQKKRRRQDSNQKKPKAPVPTLSVGGRSFAGSKQVFDDSDGEDAPKTSVSSRRDGKGLKLQSKTPTPQTTERGSGEVAGAKKKRKRLATPTPFAEMGG